MVSFELAKTPWYMSCSGIQSFSVEHGLKNIFVNHIFLLKILIIKMVIVLEEAGITKLGSICLHFFFSNNTTTWHIPFVFTQFLLLLLAANVVDTIKSDSDLGEKLHWLSTGKNVAQRQPCLCRISTLTDLSSSQSLGGLWGQKGPLQSLLVTPVVYCGDCVRWFLYVIMRIKLN